jgi:Domain of unknown function (DUF1844)
LHTPAVNGGWSQCQGISVADTDPKSATATENASVAADLPGSASNPHPRDAIPLPAHGFETLDDVPLDDLVPVPAAELITRAAVLLLDAAAQKLGLATDAEPYLDLDEARRLITALAGLLAASRDHLGTSGDSLHEGLRSLQGAFRAASRYPDEPGRGPGEQYLP